MVVVRHVGAALRGRPWFTTEFCSTLGRPRSNRTRLNEPMWGSRFCELCGPLRALRSTYLSFSSEFLAQSSPRTAKLAASGDF